VGILAVHKLVGYMLVAAAHTLLAGERKGNPAVRKWAAGAQVVAQLAEAPAVRKWAEGAQVVAQLAEAPAVRKWAEGVLVVIQ